MRIAVDGISNRLDLISEIVCKFENVSVEINRGKRGLKNKHPCQAVWHTSLLQHLGERGR